MPFRILESLDTLPDLVLATVFDFLPVAHVLPITRSTNPEFRELALRRQWCAVHVSSAPADRHGSRSSRMFYRISKKTFSAMVLLGTPPPCRIHRLVYSAWGAADDREFMTPRWRAYVSAHANSVGFEFVIRNGHDSHWSEAAPHLHGFNLVELLLRIPDGNRNQQLPLFVGVTFPNSLTKVQIEFGMRITTVPENSGFPSLLRHLEVISEGIHPGLFPTLPPNIKVLKLSADAGLDVSEVVGLLPQGLEVLAFEPPISSLPTGGPPARISSTAIQRFSPALQHNMMVYHNTAAPLEAIPISVLGSAATVNLGLGGQDYSGTVLPSCHLLEVYDDPGLGRLSAHLSLLLLNHWLPQLRVLRLKFPISLQGAEIPSTVAVEVVGKERHIPLQVWDLPRIVLLDMEPVMAGSVVSRLEQMECLTTLLLTWESPLNKIKLSAPPNVSLITLQLYRGATLPNLVLFVLVKRLVLLYRTSDCRFDASVLPVNLQQLKVRASHTHGELLPKKDPFRQPIGLGHLALLRHLELQNMPRVHLSQLEFPAGLRVLKLRNMFEMRLDGVRFPATLQHLQMSNCGLSNPWSTRARWAPQWIKNTLVAYPAGLHHLDLSSNDGMTPPPRDFVFPPRLYHLCLSGCGITNITKFRLPPTLGLLDMDLNGFPIPESYRWPQVSRITVRKSFPTPPLNRTEYGYLKRSIPGAHINE